MKHIRPVQPAPQKPHAYQSAASARKGFRARIKAKREAEETAHTEVFDYRSKMKDAA
jgi:hypothetical protein